MGCVDRNPHIFRKIIFPGAAACRSLYLVAADMRQESECLVSI